MNLLGIQVAFVNFDQFLRPTLKWQKVGLLVLQFPHSGDTMKRSKAVTNDRTMGRRQRNAKLTGS